MERSKTKGLKGKGRTIPLLASLLLFSSATSCKTKMPEDVKSTRSFIRENLPKTARHHTEDSGIYFGLPRPYSVPAIKGIFQEMYYWDTYFMNAGLIADGQLEQARKPRNLP